MFLAPFFNLDGALRRIACEGVHHPSSSTPHSDFLDPDDSGIPVGTLHPQAM